MFLDVGGQNMKNYVLFIGGTGARIYRSFLHICAAGVMREEEIQVLLLDADSKNKAVEDCQELYRLYQYHRDRLQSEDAQKAQETRAFYCKVHMPFKQVISPVPIGVTYLEDVVGGNIEQKRAMSWFYSKEERKQPLEKGFFAHPNIGCVFFQNFQDKNMQTFLKQVNQEMQQGEDVKIVLVGSVFGGTGASGLPNILKMIHAECNDHRDRLHCCGILVIPYFEVPELEGKKGGDGLVIRSREFSQNTRAALSYYQKHSAFEQIYLVGKKTLDLVNDKYVDGGKEQDNKAHIVEICGALAVKAFLEGEHEGKAWSHIVSKEVVSWRNLEEELNPVADMIRAQVVLKREIYPFIKSVPVEHKFMWRHNRQWFEAYCVGNAENREQMLYMERYTADFLHWIYDVQTKLVSGERQLDRGIELCSALVSEFAGPLGLSTGHQLQKWSGKPMLERFNSLIDTASNMEYLFDKVVLILSCLGLVEPTLAGLGSVGLLIRLFDITGQKKKKRIAAK